MAALRYRDEYNKVGYLLKPRGSDDYHQIIDFLRASHIRSPELGPLAIQAIIDKTPYTITEDLVRSQLQLADDGGIDDFPIAKIYSGMDNLRYITEGKLTFLKNKFSPQKRFLVHIILHCLSTKSGSWDQFDEPLGGSFHMSSPRSTHAPPAGQTSGGEEDLITLTALSFVVSTLVQKVNSLETELKDHKKLFKDVVGKLVKKVKAMKVRLKTTKKKMVVSDSDQEEGGKQDVDLDALLVLANAAMTVDSNISPGGASDNPAASTSVHADVPTSVNVSTGSTRVPADVPTSVAPTGVSDKGKTPMVEEDITVKERTFKQMQEDKLGEQAAKRLHDEEQAQVEANESLFKTLLGDDVSEDNFPARMAALIKRKKHALAEKLAKERRDRPMTQGQQRTYMRQFVKNQSCTVYSTAKKLHDEEQAQVDIQKPELQRRRQQEVLDSAMYYTEADWIHIMVQVEANKSLSKTLLVVSSPKSSGTKRKSLGRNRLTKPKSKLKELDLDADDQTFIKGDLQVLFDSHEGGKGFFVWQNQHLWQIRSWRLYTLSNALVLETVSGDVVYMFVDVSYPLLVKIMERMLKHKLEIDKDVVGNVMTTVEQLIRFIKNQLAAAQFTQNYRVFNSPMLHLLRVEMVINSPWIMPILGTKELASPEQTAPVVAFSRDVLLICADFSSILVTTQSSRYVVPTGRVVVPTGRYVVLAGNVIIVSTGRLSLIPTGRVISPGRI
nr:ribonuclease H-like domain-containing protein [Tanacetum cinerariifolium]